MHDLWQLPDGERGIRRKRDSAAKIFSEVTQTADGDLQVLEHAFGDRGKLSSFCGDFYLTHSTGEQTDS